MTDIPNDEKTDGSFSDEPDHVVRQTIKACWLRDYENEVKISTQEVFEKYLENGEHSDLEARTQWNAHYKMVIPLKTGGKVLVQMTFSISKMDGDVTDQDVEQAKQYVSNISNVWNGKYTLKVTDIRNSYCGSKELPIEFDLQFAQSGEAIENGEKHPHAIKLYKKVPKIGNIDRPRLENGNTFILEKDPSPYNVPYTYAHEFGHALGLPDEYGYEEDIDSVVQYYKPDGSLDATKIPAPCDDNPKQKGDPTENIMGFFGSLKVAERQGWVLGIAAQKIIDQHREKYKCDIIFNGE